MQIVDKNDELIGLKSWEEFDVRRDIYRVSALWLTNRSGEVVLAQRGSTTNNQPGRWMSAVAGTLEDNETYYENIVKETEEEIGLKNISFKLGPKRFEQEGDRRFFVQWYTAILDTPLETLILEPDEVAAVKLMDPVSLRNDIIENPKTYVSSMSDFIDLFIKPSVSED